MQASSGNRICALDSVWQIHRDGKRPILHNGQRFCAYSLLPESRRPVCPFNHRSQKPIAVQGDRITYLLLRCFDARSGYLPETEYIHLD